MPEGDMSTPLGDEIDQLKAENILVKRLLERLEASISNRIDTDAKSIRDIKIAVGGGNCASYQEYERAVSRNKGREDILNAFRELLEDYQKKKREAGQ